MYQATNFSCSYCKSPCKSCTGTDSNCTACFRESLIPNLFINQCIDKCPRGWVSMDGVCTKCRSPCALCDGHPDKCVSCDGTGGTKYVHNQKCFADCPAGTGPNSNELTCFPCLEGCDLCDIQNITQCLKCTAPSLVHEGGCVNPCPPNYVADGISCREWELKDAGIIPFPFLIATLIFIVICLFGRMKKRAFISKGKMAIKSP